MPEELVVSGESRLLDRCQVAGVRLAADGAPPVAQVGAQQPLLACLRLAAILV